jgi:hypothetical protein
VLFVHFGLYKAVVERGEEIRRISVLDERGRTLETTDHLRLSERFGHVSAVTLHRSALHEAAALRKRRAWPHRLSQPWSEL